MNEYSGVIQLLNSTYRLVLQMAFWAQWQHMW